MVIRSAPLPALALSEGEGAARSIDIVFRTPFSSMVIVWCQAVIMRYDRSALGNTLYVGFFVVLDLFVLTASFGLSTKTISFSRFEDRSFAF